MTQGRRFQRREESFTCANCGTAVVGDGYTNHCPQCLWSRHVDVNPGDRAESCGGMMEPVSVERTGDEFVLLHRCEKCRFERRQRTCAADSMDAIIELSVSV